MAKKTPPLTELSRSFFGAENADLDAAIVDVANAIYNLNSTKTKKVSFSQKTFSFLMAEFRNAEQSLEIAEKFMQTIAKEIGIDNLEEAIHIVPMKDWDRAVEKSAYPDRDLHDLGRGTIYVNSVEEVKRLITLLNGMDDDGNLKIKGPKSQRVQIIGAKFDNYLRNPRSSGDSGRINFDLKIDLGNNRFGKFEVQVRPADYKKTDVQSHFLFEMIRNLKRPDGEEPEPARKELMDALISANAALFDEIAARKGFDKLRAKPPKNLPLEEVFHINVILDRVWTAFEEIGGRRFKWRTETQEAITHAKTCLLNLYQRSLDPNNPGIDDRQVK